MFVKPESRNISATIERRSEKITRTFPALAVFESIRMPRSPAELMYSIPPRSTTSFVAPASSAAFHSASKSATEAASRLPEARDLGTNLLQESGLENLFRTANSRSALEALLCPDIGDGSLVSPEIFEADLHALLEKLRKSENPKIQALVREEIEPLLQNGLLLTAYRNLMLGG